MNPIERSHQEASPRVPIVVVGGGIGGLAAALALALKGRRVTVLEQCGPELADSDQGSVQLSPNVWRALKQLGVYEQIVPAARRVDRLELWDATNGQPLQTVPLTACKERYGEPMASVSQSFLHKVLLNACDANPAIELRFTSPVISLGRPNQQVPDGPPILCANLADSSIEASAVIGADGIESIVRQHLWPQTRAAAAGGAGMTALHGQVSLQQVNTGAQLEPGQMQVWWARGAHAFIFEGDSPGHWQVSFYARSGASLQETVAALRVAFEHTPLIAWLEAQQAWSVWQSKQQAVLAQWGKGRITLLGDSAHAGMPFLLPGPAMALEDAVTLADCVSWAPGLSEAFAAYERLRKPRDRRIQQLNLARARIDHAGGWVRWLRNRVVQKRDPASPLEALAWVYEH